MKTTMRLQELEKLLEPMLAVPRSSWGECASLKLCTRSSLFTGSKVRSKSQLDLDLEGNERHRTKRGIHALEGEN